MALRRVIKWPFERPKLVTRLAGQVRFMHNHSRESDVIEARRTVDLWLQRKGAANEKMVTAIVHAFCRDGKIWDAEQALRIAESHGRWTITKANTVLPLFWHYAKEGKKADAEAMMSIILERKMKMHAGVMAAMAKLQGSPEALIRYLEDNKVEFTERLIANIFGIALRLFWGDVEPVRKKMAELGMGSHYSIYMHLMARALRYGDLTEFSSVLKHALSDKNVKRDFHFYKMLLDMLANVRDVEGTRAAFQAMMDDGYTPTRKTVCRLALAHSLVGDIEGFRECLTIWYEVTGTPHVSHCIDLSKCALVLGDTESIEDIYRHARNDRLWVTANYMSVVIRALGRDGRLEDAEKVFEEAKMRDIYLIERVYDAMVDVYGRNGELDKAVSVFRECPEKKRELIEHMIKAYARNGRPQEAASMFEKFAARIDNPSTLFKAQIQMVLAHGLARDYGTARKLFDEMKDTGVSCDMCPRIFTNRQSVGGVVAQLYSDMITVCGICGQTDEIWNVFSDLVGRKKFNPSPWVFARVITAYGRNGLVDDALAAYEEMARFRLQPDAPVYDAVIGAHAAAHDYESATNVLREMVARGYRPSGCTFREMLTPALEAGDLAMAFRLMETLLKLQPKPGRGIYELVIRKAHQRHSLQEIVKRFLEIRRSGAKTDDETIDRIIGRTWESERKAAQDLFRARYSQSGTMLEAGHDAGEDRETAQNLS